MKILNVNTVTLKMIKRRVLLLTMLSLLTFLNLHAADGQGDFFQNIGKIYVVVAVVLATFIGIVIFLIFLERRIKKLEDSIKQL